MNDFIEFLIMYFGVIMMFVFLIIVASYYSSCQEAKIYNQLNESNYTCSDFFWAGDQINSQSQTINIK